MKAALTTAMASILSLAILGIIQRRTINTFLMGVFRDLGRIKARKRRMAQNPTALVTATTDWDILLRRDDPLEMLDLDNDGDESDGTGTRTTYTLEELAQYGDGLDGRPILLSIFGRVYDVSSGSKFYGPEGSYSMFAGRDVTHALSTGCKSHDCVVSDASGLNEKQLKEGKRWLSFFQMHDKYAYVGTLEGQDASVWLDLLVEAGLREGEETAAETAATASTTTSATQTATADKDEEGVHSSGGSQEKKEALDTDTLEL